MQEVTLWWEQYEGDTRKWLILGKGPTFERREDFDLTSYRTIALNHAIREVSVDIASVVDIDVIRDCSEDIYRNCRYLLMPRFPHLQNWSAQRPLEDFFDELPVLRRLHDENRLVWYNLQSSPPIPGSPSIPLQPFSVGVILYLLALLGVRTVRTLGVDGGKTYAPTFNDLAGRTLLINGKSNFDVQFEGIAHTIHRFKLDFAPLVGNTPFYRASLYGYFVRRSLKNILKPWRDRLGMNMA